MTKKPRARHGQSSRAEAASGTRIWHQSITDLTVLPGYAGMLAEHARQVCDAGTTVDLHGVRPGTYPPGVAPIEMARSRWSGHLRAIQIVENVMRAEREGYDAVAISCFVDPGLEEARSLVDIPVVSSLETALLVSSTMGRAFGLIALDEGMAHRLRKLIRGYGFQDRVVSVSPLAQPLTEHQLDKAFAGSKEFVNSFTEQARGLIRDGADVVIPAEGVLNTVLVRNKLCEIDGIPVLDSYGAVLGMAEMLVRLRNRTGLRVGRGAAYFRPSAGIVNHLRRVTGEALEEMRKLAEPGK